MLQRKSFRFFHLFVLLLSATFACRATSAALPTEKTTVAYLGPVSENDFQTKIRPLFQERTRSCKDCEIFNQTPYTKTGELDREALMERIKTLPMKAQIVYFDFNMKVNDQNKALVELLNKKSEEGLIVVGTAGVPPATESSGPLSRTVLGQVHRALIIGELADKDRLPPTGFYGPEMLTALRPPRDMLGQNMSPLLFTAALSAAHSKNSSRDWVLHLREKKLKSRKIWMDMGDMF